MKTRFEGGERKSRCNCHYIEPCDAVNYSTNKYLIRWSLKSRKINIHNA